MKTCLIITDSIGFPRENPFTPFENTWPGLLESSLNENGFVVYSFQKKGLDTKRIVSELNEHLVHIKPDLAIMQIGIVDCSPRALKESEINLLNKLPFLSRIIKKVVKRNYQIISKYRNLSYIDLTQFEANLNKIKSAIDCKKIIIPIGLPCDAYFKTSPLIKNRVHNYNSILKKVFKNEYLEEVSTKTSSILNDIYTDDHYHLNNYGHKIFHNTIEKVLPSANTIDN